MSTHHLANLEHAHRHHGELLRRAADERQGRRQRRRHRRTDSRNVTAPGLDAPDG